MADAGNLDQISRPGLAGTGQVRIDIFDENARRGVLHKKTSAPFCIRLRRCHHAPDQDRHSVSAIGWKRKDGAGIRQNKIVGHFLRWSRRHARRKYHHQYNGERSSYLGDAQDVLCFANAELKRELFDKSTGFYPSPS